MKTRIQIGSGTEVEIKKKMKPFIIRNLFILGSWIALVLVIFLFRIVVAGVPGISNELSWTLTNLIFNLVSFSFEGHLKVSHFPLSHKRPIYTHHQSSHSLFS
jgi:hypothetical protein